ncbi:MAG: aminotransferase class V-fold PLP-dependent enzyme [Clostridia bacterium]|nr:aminotransferase class V-fold PLP-dependent enzyme [Clostridia bacterium]
MTYLDNAATTLIKPQSVTDAVTEAIKTAANAGRGGHGASMRAADILFECRETAADFFGAKSAENIIFTLNATHALNIAIHGIMGKGGHAVISGYEHNSVVRPLAFLGDKGVSFSVARAPLFEPELMVEAINREIKKNTKAVIVTHVSNVFGYILPIKEINALCASKGIPLVIDAAQSAGCIPVKLNDLTAVRFVCMPGHKGLYGPQGTGILVCRDGREISPLMQGGTGSQSHEAFQPDFLPDRHETGTQNAHGIAGLNAGIKFVCKVSELYRHERELLDYCTEEIGKISGATLYYDHKKQCQSGVLSFNLARVNADEVSYQLSLCDIAVRSGFHCAPLAHETAGDRMGTVRVSFSVFNDFSDVETLVSALKKINV